MFDYDRTLQYANQAEMGSKLDLGKALRALTEGTRVAGISYASFTDGEDCTDELNALVRALGTNCTIFVVEPGTYTIDALDLAAYVFRLVGGPGVIFKHATNATGPMFTVGSRTVFEGVEFNGNKANLSTDRAIIYANNPTRLRIQCCKFSSGSKHFVHIDDGQDNDVSMNEMSDCDQTAIEFFAKTSAGCKRNIVARNIIDRTTNGAADGGGIKFSYSTGGTCDDNKALANVVRLSNAPSGSNQVCIECWSPGRGFAAVHNTVIGGEIGISVANDQQHAVIAANHGQDCDTIIFEVVDGACYASVTGNTGDGNANSVTIISIDGTGGDALYNVVSGNTCKGPTSRCILLWSGADQATVAGNRLHHAAASTYGLEANTVDGLSLTGNTANGGGTAGFLFTNCNDWNADNNRSVGNMHPFQVVANDAAVDNISLGNWHAVSASGFQLVIQGTGSFGDNISSGIIHGATPYGVTMASFRRLKASFADCIWSGGLTTFDPNSIPVDGEIMSELSDVTNGVKYLNTTGANTGWKTVTHS